MTSVSLALVEASAVFGPASAAGIVPAVVLALACVIAFYYTDCYDLRSTGSVTRFAARLPRSVALALAPLAVLHVLAPHATVLSGPIAWALLSSLGLLLALRALFYRLTRNRAFVERVLILGRGPLARVLIEEIEARPHSGYVVAGVADLPKSIDGPVAHFRWLGGLYPLSRILAQVRPARIVVALADRRGGRLPVRQLMESRVLNGIVVEDAAEVYERVTGKLAIESLTPGAFVFSRDYFKSRAGLAVGRLLSVLVAAAGLVVLSPLLGLIALAIKVDSRGPVFFLHDRVGLRGAPFRLIKFRTMVPSDGSGSQWVLDNRHRITRVGRWLRMFRLDELPQFVNVLRGHLNLVGPRPHPASNFELFMETIPHYWLRATVRPGITGWAQIRYGYANNLAEETEKMRYDLYYIKHLSPWFDLRILVDTVKTVFLGRGATAATPRSAALPELPDAGIEFDPAA